MAAIVAASCARRLPHTAIIDRRYKLTASAVEILQRLEPCLVGDIEWPR